MEALDPGTLRRLETLWSDELDVMALIQRLREVEWLFGNCRENYRNLEGEGRSLREYANNLTDTVKEQLVHITHLERVREVADKVATNLTIEAEFSGDEADHSGLYELDAALGALMVWEGK